MAFDKSSGVKGGLCIELVVGEWMELIVGGQPCRLLLIQTKGKRAKFQVQADKDLVKINRASFSEKRPNSPKKEE